MKIDKKDSRILFELDRNSRISIKELARKAKLSRDVVGYRIKRLEKENIIKNYITIIDFTKIGFSIVRLYLKFRKRNFETEQKIIEHFKKKKNILTIYEVDGKYDLAVGFLHKDLKKFWEEHEKFLFEFKEQILFQEITFFMDYIHHNKNYFVEEKLRDYSTVSIGSYEKVHLDEKDIELIQLIKDDARISLLDLSKKLKMTPMGVKYKLKNLEKSKVIVAYKMLIDTNKLGYSYYKVDVELENFQYKKAIQEFITRSPNTIYQNIVVGGRDIEFDTEFSSQKEFYDFMDSIKNQFPEQICSFFYIRIKKIHKYSYFPEIID